jgi:hypothetical protein
MAGDRLGDPRHARYRRQAGAHAHAHAHTHAHTRAYAYAYASFDLFDPDPCTVAPGARAIVRRPFDAFVAHDIDRPGSPCL